MATPEAPRTPEQGMARALNKGAPGQQMGAMTGLSPVPRGIQRARRMAPAAGATSGVVLKSTPSPGEFDYADWLAGTADPWVEKDSWGDVAFTWAANAGAVTCPEGMYALTSIAECQLEADRALKVSMNWSTGPAIPGPQDIVYGPGGAHSLGGSASVTGIRNPGDVSPYFSAYDLTADGDTPVTNIPVILTMTLIVVRLSD